MLMSLALLRIASFCAPIIGNGGAVRDEVVLFANFFRERGGGPDEILGGNDTLNGDGWSGAVRLRFMRRWCGRN